MIFVDVRIANCVHKLACLQATNMRQHMREQRIAGDVKWHAKTLDNETKRRIGTFEGEEISNKTLTMSPER